MKRIDVKTRGAAHRGASTVLVHAVLAALALTAAYLTWTRDKTQVQSEQVAALSAGKRDVQSVTYKDDNRTVTVERKLGGDGEAYAWVTVSTKSKQLLTPAGMGAPGGMGGPMGGGSAMDPHGGAPHGDPHGAAPPPAPAHGGPAVAPGAAGAAKPVTPTAPAAAKPAAPAPAPAARPVPAPGKGGDKAAAGKEAEKTPPTSPAAKPAVAAPAPADSKPAPAGSKPAPAAPTAPAAAPAVAPAAPTAAAPGAPAAAPATSPPTPIHEIKETTVTKSFRGSEQADKLLESFGPLMALRSLGQIDDAKAKELGLTDSKKTLTVQIKDQQTVFTIGNTSYGAGDIYVRDGQGRVFLLASRFQSDFEYAESRLMERRLHRFERGDISRVEVTAGAKKKVLVQQKRQDPVNYSWAEEATPDKKDDTLRNWMDKVLRVAISDYVAKGEEPQPPAASQAPGAPAYGDVLTMRFFDGKKPIGQATFSRFPKGNGSDYFATTETTIGLVRLLSATAESTIQDAEKW